MSLHVYEDYEDFDTDEWADVRKGLSDKGYEFTEEEWSRVRDLLLASEYVRGVDYDFVHPRIATGGAIYSPDDVDTLIRSGITHVVTQAAELDYETHALLAGRLPHLRNGRGDDGIWKGKDWFAPVLDFTADALRDPNAKVYIHCGAGINRGPSGAYAVLRGLFGYSPDAAMEALNTARPITKHGVAYQLCADVALKELGYTKDGPERPAKFNPFGPTFAWGWE